MVNEEVIIQTSDEVSQIDYMRVTNDIINNQTKDMQENMDIISEQLDVLLSNDGVTTSANVDLSEVTSLIEDIDTTIVEANTQDILNKISRQQEQINEINNKLDMILEKM